MSWGAFLLRDLTKSGQDWWGYIVYRTTYGDDQAWQQFKDKFEKYRQVAPQALDASEMPPEDAQTLRRTLRLEYVEDPELDGADYVEVRRRFIEHCHDNMWSVSSRGRNQMCLMIDEASMRSVVEYPAPGDPDWDMRFVVERPMPGALDYSIVERSRMPSAYVVVVDRHYDQTRTTPEPGDEEVDRRPDTLKVAVSDVLAQFYFNLLCDLQLDELIPSRKSGIWSDYGMRTRYREEREDSTDGILRQEAKGRMMASIVVPVLEPGTSTTLAQGAPPIPSPADVILDRTTGVSGQTAAEEKTAPISQPVSDTEKRVLYIRHKVQKAMLSRVDLPQDSDMPAVSDHLKWLEDHDIDADVIRHTKINKVVKAVLKLVNIPRDDEFRIRTRCMKLLGTFDGKLLQS